MPPSIAFAVAACLAGSPSALWAGTPDDGSVPYEAPPVFEASALVSEDLLSGPYHKLRTEVPVKSYMMEFTIASEFGEFAAEGVPLLETRIGELAALDWLAEVSKSDAFVNAAAKAATGPFKTAYSVATKPVATIKGIPSGASRYMRAIQWRGKKASVRD